MMNDDEQLRMVPAAIDIPSRQNQIHKQMRQSKMIPRTNWKRSIASLVLTFVLCLLMKVGTAQGFEEWEQWNYYQILGLFPGDYYEGNGKDWVLKSRRKRNAERSNIQPREIKKAYRKQAQLWHPDKISNSKSKETVDDRNARFSKIAEAYEVLSDDEKRSEYDSHLLDMEDDMDRSHSKDQHSSSLFENLRNDPMSVFEEFFFGSNSAEMFDDTSNSVFGDDTQPQYGHRTSSRQPDRMSETTQVFYDQRFGQMIHKVLRKEEYDETESGSVYYRLIAQDFIEEFDVIFGNSLGYRAVSDPYLVEEGNMSFKQSREYRADDYSELHNDYEKRFASEQEKPRRKLDRVSSRLEKSDYITPQSKYLRSVNTKFYAGLTPDCELVIMRDEGIDEDDSLVWTSGTYIPPQHQDVTCALSLYGERLAVIIGDVNDPAAVLWSSPVAGLSPTKDLNGETIVEYYASLDDDGSLVIYRRRRSETSGTSHNKNENQSHSYTTEVEDKSENLFFSIKNFVSDMLSTQSALPSTRASAAWTSFKRWTVSAITSNPVSNFEKKEPRKRKIAKRHDECVFATGPAGCFSSGRYVVKILSSTRRRIDKTIHKLDSALDGFLESLSEGSEEDDDVLDTLVRVVGKAGTSAGQGCFRMAKESASMVKDKISELKVET